MKQLSGIAMIVMLVGGLVLSSCSTPAPPAPTTAPAPSPKPTVSPSPTATSSPTPAPSPKPTTAPAPARKIKLTASVHTGTSHTRTQELRFFANNVSQRTGGQVEIQIYDSGTLVGGKDMLNAVRTGIVDMGLLVPTYWPGDFPVSNDIGILPFAFKGWDNIPEVLELARPILDKEFKARNIQILFQPPSNTEWFSAKEYDPANPDWKGMKVMTIGGAFTTTIEKFGGTPVFITSAELPVAIGTGVVNGAGGISFTSYDVLDMYSKLPFAYLTGGFFNTSIVQGINMEAWNKLPPDIQKIFMEESKKALLYSIEQNKANDEPVLNKIKAHAKAKLIVLTPEQRKVWSTKLQSIWDDVAAKNGDEVKKFIEALRKMNS